MALKNIITGTKFRNAAALDSYFKTASGAKMLNKDLWFNLKVWLDGCFNQGKFTGYWDDFEVTCFGKNGESPCGTLPHKLGSRSHDPGYAIDLGSGEPQALYIFFHYLKDLANRGAKIRVHASLHNRHIHVDCDPAKYGDVMVEVTRELTERWSEELDQKYRIYCNYNDPLKHPEDNFSNNISDIEPSSFGSKLYIIFWFIVAFFAYKFLKKDNQMAIQTYFCNKEITVFNNSTAAIVPANGDLTIRRKNGTSDSIQVIPGMMIAFRNLASFDCDTADYANLTVAEYLFEDAAFFLR